MLKVTITFFNAAAKAGQCSKFAKKAANVLSALVDTAKADSKADLAGSINNKRPFISGGEGPPKALGSFGGHKRKRKASSTYYFGTRSKSSRKLSHGTTWNLEMEIPCSFTTPIHDGAISGK